MSSFPRDRFDDIPTDIDRVGAHRGPAPRGRGWIRFAWAALATGVLVVGGLYGLSRLYPSIPFDFPDLGGPIAQPGTAPTSAPEVVPITDPALVDPALGLTVSVLNASPTDGQAQVAATQVAAAGWPSPSFANSTVRDAAETFVYYRSADLEPAALGIAQLIGVDADHVVLSDAYLGATVTIVLGEDYEPPAG